ncbi:MAG: sensor histidine kinase [Lachnospiraceae bacterium]|nr:sensor histidine kinase [Lachnospiraceae bacterium]
MKKNRKRIHLKNIRLRERMLLIYIIGGIIPFIGTSIYVSSQSGNAVLEAGKLTQKETVSFLAAETTRLMGVAERVAGELSEDPELRRIVETDYESGKLPDKDLQAIKKLLMFQKDYRENFSNITIYTNNEAIYNTSPFAALTENEKASKWYKWAMQSEKTGYWSYYDTGEQREIQYACALKNDADSEIGVITIHLNARLLSQLMQENSMNVMLLHMDGNVVVSNLPQNQLDNFLIKQISNFSKDTDTITVSRNVDEYLLTYRKIRFPNQSGGYTVVCIQDYRQIKGTLNHITLNTYIIAGLSLVVSVLMIGWFSGAFGTRLKTLRRQMFLVANGRYEAVEPIGGNDEIAEIYQEVEKMMGDIQDLTANIVQEKVQKEKLHTRQKEVEFKMLASQINPHFLYNTLETIRMKARVNGQTEIEDLVKMLAKILRRNIQVSNQMVSLRSEIELTENYLKIQEYRFGDRIVSQVIIAPGVDLDMKVMPLIIQPFVENAFVHGLEALSRQGKLIIEVTQEEEDVFIYIRDNGIGMPYYKLGNLRHTLNSGENADQTHIGINNVNQRLRIQYGDQYGVRIDSSEAEGTTVEIHIPQNP